MGTVAAELKAEREKRKISLDQIAAETRISRRHLQSLEEGRFSDLPGGMYNRAFLKAYCDFLNLDLQQVLQKYEAEISPVPEKTSRSKLHASPKDRSFRISPIFVWGFMLVISAVGLFFSRKWISAIFSPYFSSTPVATVRYDPVQPQEAAPSPAPAPTAPANDAAIQQGLTGTSDAAGASVSPGAAPANPTAVPGASPEGMRLEITATEECWVSVNRDGAAALQKVMRAGEVQSFEASEKFQIVVGNAAGVQMKINGKPARPLGKPGEVVKIVVDEKNLPVILGESAG